MASLFTSQYPTTRGILGVQTALKDDLETLPGVLQRDGCTTAAIVSNGFCGSKWNLDQGFESSDESHVGNYRRATPGAAPAAPAASAASAASFAARFRNSAAYASRTWSSSS